MTTTDIRTRAKEALAAGKVFGDGHTIFRPEFYLPFFTYEELKKARLVQKHKSDGSHKGSIFGPDGKMLDTLEGVYNLNFLYWLAYQVGVTKSVQANGRGFQAQELVGYIAEALAAE